MTDDAEDWDCLIRGLASGDADVAADFCRRYGPLLHKIAAGKLPSAAQRRVTADTVAQSACRTFLRRAQSGLFELADSQQLWQLLCAITLNKAREHVRFHLRQRRSLKREESADNDSSTPSAADQPAEDDSPATLVEMADQLQQLLDSLDEEERQIVELKLQDRTNLEIAAELGCSERTVRRILQGLKSRFVKAFVAGDA